MSDTRPRIVLDTNACLDLWVFGDPRAAGLLAALQAGALAGQSRWRRAALGRRIHRDGLFEIVSPQTWVLSGVTAR